MCICAAPTTPFEGVTVYGRRQAADYQEVRRFFDGRGVVFDHADIEGDQFRVLCSWPEFTADPRGCVDAILDLWKGEA